MTQLVGPPDDVIDQLEHLANYFNFEFEPEVYRVYTDALQHVPAAAMQAACRQLITTHTFMPKVAEIRAALGAALAPKATDIRSAFSSGYICAKCEDNGWVFVGANTVRRCECHHTNPRLRR